MKKVVAIWVGVFVALVVLNYALLVVDSSYNLWWQHTFGVKFEDARRENYEHTKSFTDGNVQRLSNLCKEVAAADDAHKALLNDIIAHEFVKTDTADVPDYLRSCLTTARAH